MKITLNELRQIVKSIIKEEMTGTPSNPTPAAGATTNTATTKAATVTPFDTLAQTLSTMNPKPVSGMTQAGKIINFGKNRLIINVNGGVSFDEKYSTNKDVKKYWYDVFQKEKRTLFTSLEPTFFTETRAYAKSFSFNMNNPTKIKEVLQGFFKQFPL